MNRIYRIVWSIVLNAWIAVSENAKGRGKRSSKRKLILTALALSVAPLAQAAPTGGQVVSGSGTIAQTASTTNIQQTTQNLSLNWQTFNVAQTETVNFVQPSATAIAVNRIFDTNGSQILGHLNANGQVWLINPNGVLFGQGAQVNVGGLVASTLDFNEASLGSGSVSFSGTGTGSIINQGSINAANGGYVALLGNHVSNQGTIVAQLGTVALGAGSAATLTFSGSSLVHMQVDQSTLNNLAENGGLIKADGGQILLTAGAQNAVLASVVNNTGILEASTVNNQNGTIILSGGMVAGTVNAGGTIDVSSATASGGQIIATANNVIVADNATLNATGATGGGTINIGGGWQGSGGIAQATTVYVAPTAMLDASATQQGDGGKVVLWSDVHNANSQTTANGSIMARGGVNGGNGGQVETSGHNVNIDGIRVNAGANQGSGGLWLIDPADSTITQTVADSYKATLDTGTDVLNDVTGSIAWNSGVYLHKTAGGDATLTLRIGNAGNGTSINLNGATIDSTAGALNLVLWTKYNTPGYDGAVSITNSIISTNGGHVWVGGSDDVGGSVQSTTWNGLSVGTGYASTWGTDKQGIYLSSSSISTGAGSISLKGKSHDSTANPGVRNFGVLIDSGSSLNTTSGSITLDGKLRGSFVNGTGMQIGTPTSAPVTGDVSITSGTGAINITGTGEDQSGSGSGWRHAVVIQSGAVGNKVTVRSGSGAITVTGTASFGAGGDFTNDTSGIQLGTVDTTGSVKVVSTSGAITLRGQNSQQVSQYENALRFAPGDAADNIRIGYDGSTAYSGNILIEGDSILQRNNLASAGSLAIQTTGTLTIAPMGNSFTALRAGNAGTLTFDNDWNFGSSLSSFTLGKTTNTMDIILSNALTVAGPISIYGGNIALNNSLASTASGAAILVSATGDISTVASPNTITTNNGNISLIGDSDANSSGLLNLTYKTISAGTGNVLVRGETFNWGAGIYPTISSTTGTFTFESSDASFGIWIDVGWFNLPSTLSGLTIGKSTNTFDVSVSTNALNIAGPISMYGGNIFINSGATLTSTAGTQGILLKATGGITDNANLTTNGGDITLWANSEGAPTGGISLSNNITLSSSGGAITLGGSVGTVTGLGTTLPQGYAASSTVDGILLGATNANTTTINSGGGDVNINGNTTATTGIFNGVHAFGALTINSDTGAIALTGASSAYYGVEFSDLNGIGSGNGLGTTALTLISSKSSGTAISLTGTTTAANSYGIVFDYNSTKYIEATGGGAIAINGTGTGSSYGLFMPGTQVMASAGPIGINGGTGGISFVNVASTMGKLAGTGVTTSISNITLTGDLVNVGVATTVDTTGTLTVQPYSTSFSSALTTANLTLASTISALTLGKAGNTAGITVANALNINGPISIYGGNIVVNATLSAAGNILLQGDTGAPLTSANSYPTGTQNDAMNGVTLNANVSTTAGSNGNITINGRGLVHANFNPSYGVYDNNVTVQAGGSGAVAITGIGGATHSGVNGSNFGVYLKGAAAQVLSSGGNISITGTGGGDVGSGSTGGSYNYGVWADLATVWASGTGSVSITGTGGAYSDQGNTAVVLGGAKVKTGDGTSSAGGAITITGTSGLLSTIDTNGIWIGNGTTGAVSSIIGSSTTGAITLTGTGPGSGTDINLAATTTLGAVGYAGNITLNADSFSFASTSITTTGALTIQSRGTSFSSAVSTAGLTLGSGITGLTLGKDIGNTAHTDTITVESAASINGPINIYGGAISITSTLSTGTSGGAVNITSSGSIAESFSGLISTTGLLTTSSVTGAMLGGANSVGSFNATNSTSGNIELTNTATTLTITGISETGGNISVINTGALTTNGVITTTSANGTIGLTATTGVETIGAAVTANGSGSITLQTTGANDVLINAAVSSTSGALNVTSGGAITEGGGTAGTLGTSGLLTTSSATGETLSNANTVGSFNATNTTSGNIALTNTATTLTITGISETGGNITVGNTGALTVGAAIDAGAGTVDLKASGNLALNAGITTTNNTASAIMLNAGYGTAAGTSTGGDITVSGGSLSYGADGRATLYTGSITGSLTSAALAGSAGSGKFRYNSNSTTTNYTAALGAGTYEIYREQPTLTITAVSPTAITYGSTAPTFTFSVAGANGDTASQALSTQATVASDGVVSTSGNLTAANHTLTASGALDQLGYAINYSTGSLVVNKKDLTVGGVSGVGKVYDANTTATLGGTAAITKVGTDDVTLGGTAIATFALKDVGLQGVTVTGYSLSGTDVGNYNFTQPTGFTANITAAPLVITANADAKLLTLTDTAGYNGVSYSGLVGGETSAVLSGTLAISRSNSGTEGAGSYTGVLVPTGLTSSNYSITYANGNYTIVPADQLLVRVTNTSSTYGTAPTFSITSAEYLNGSNVLKTLTQSSASGNTSTWSDGVGGSATFTLAPSGASSSTSGNYVVGNYAITGGNTSIAGSNFTALNFVGNLAVTQLALTASTSNVSKVYDSTISMTGVTLGLTGLITNDLLTVNGTGAFATKHVGSNLGYTISNLALAGADASNYYLSGGTSFSGSNGVITAAPLTISGITASNKVYDGSTSATVNTSGAIYAGLFGGDTVTVSATGVFGDRNVGTGKTVTLSSNYSGSNLTDYLITDQTSTTANITQLASVTWIGGATGSWSNPANWAGGAIPDLSNVANVVIPTGSNVTFDSGVAGPVNLSQLTSGGLTVNSGTLNISDALNLQNYNQSGGLVEGAGSFTVTNAFDQTGGMIAMGGDVNITQTAGNLSFANISGNNVTLSSPNGGTALGDLTTTGTLAVTTNGGAITQSAGTSVNIGGVTTLSASNGGTPADITLANAGNIFGGAVNANGNNVALTDAGPLTLGLVTTTGNLTANSTGALNLGTSTVGGNLAVNSGNGDVTQTGALAVKGTTNIVAGTGNVTLTNASNLLVGTVTASGNIVSITKGGQQAMDNVVAQLESTLLPVLANLQPPTVRVSPTITVSQASGSDAMSGGEASSSESGSANKAEVNVKMSIGEMGPTLRIENGGIKLPDNIANVELSQNTNQGESDRSQGKSQL